MNTLGTWAAAMAAMLLTVGAHAATTVEFASTSPVAPRAAAPASATAATRLKKEPRPADAKKPASPATAAPKPSR